MCEWSGENKSYANKFGRLLVQFGRRLIWLLLVLFLLEASHVLYDLTYTDIVNVHQPECRNVHEIIFKVVQIECINVKRCV